MHVQYGVGDVTGALCSDTMRIGEAHLAQQNILLVDNIAGMDLRFFDGLVGLAWPMLSHSGTTVLENLKGAGYGRFSILLSVLSLCGRCARSADDTLALRTMRYGSQNPNLYTLKSQNPHNQMAKMVTIGILTLARTGPIQSGWVYERPISVAMPSALTYTYIFVLPVRT